MAVMREVVAEAPDVIVHCAAYTAVDAAESDSERAMRVNRDGTAHVAAAAAAVGAKLVHISSDYVFDGAKRTPYAPADEVAPLSVYGRTKAESEVSALGARLEADVGATPGSVTSATPGGAPGALVVRTGWLYGSGGRSFVDTVRERVGRGEAMRVVNDQRGSPTWTRDVAESTLELTLGGAVGVWHVAAAGEGSWFDFAKAVAGMTTGPVSRAAEIAGVTAAEWGAPARRPAYSVLDLTETERALGRPMPEWRASLERFMNSASERDALQGQRP